MSDSRTVTGGRDDLVLDSSRCLRMRFCDSACRRCVEACPHGAVALGDGLAVNPELCRGCLLCTSVCPAGALEQTLDFHTCLAKLSTVSEPILGCVRTAGSSHAALACLGGLSDEHLLTLSHTLAGCVSLNLSHCRDCPNTAMTGTLKQRLTDLFGAGLISTSARIITAESPADVRYCDEALDRRGFFNALRTSLFSSAAVILSPHAEAVVRRSDYAGKRIPNRRLLLNGVRERVSQDLLHKIQKRFDTGIAIAGNCSGCQGCVAICPSGALSTVDSDSHPAFDLLACTGCGLCVEFCLDGAVTAPNFVVSRP